MKTIIRFVCFVVSLLAIAGPAYSQRLDNNCNGMRGAVIDSRGTIWGISWENRGKVCRWKEAHWTSRYTEPGEDSYPYAIAIDSQDVVYVLWVPSGRKQRFFIRRYQGQESHLVGDFNGTLDMPHMNVDSGKNIWITHQAPQVRRITQQGSETIYSVPDSVTNCALLHCSHYNSIYTTEDGKKRMWIWSDSLGATNYASLRGLLIFDGTKFDRISSIAGIAGELLSFVARKDEKTMWVGVRDEGLYEVDTFSFSAVRVAEPEQRAFRFVQKVFEGDGALFVVSGTPWWEGISPVTEALNVLWRRRDGHWEKLIQGLDRRPEMINLGRRPVLHSQDWDLIGAFGHGPWLVGKDYPEPIMLDWRVGFPMQAASWFFPIDDRHILFVGDRQQDWVGQIDNLASTPTPVGIKTFHSLSSITQTQDGALWSILKNDISSLSKWDGQQWTPYPLPAELRPNTIGVLASDQAGNIWLMKTGSVQSDVAIYDPKGSAWKRYQSLADALVEQSKTSKKLALGEKGLLSRSVVDGKRVAFQSRLGMLFYFDGKMVRWNDLRYFFPDGLVDELHFNKEGSLLARSQGVTFVLGDDWRWKSADGGVDPPGRSGHRTATDVPKTCGRIDKIDSFFSAENGMAYFTSGGMLYKTLGELCIPLFLPDSHHPFIDGREVLASWVDPVGNTALLTRRNDFDEYLLLPVSPAVPKTTINLQPLAEDSFLTTFLASGPGEPWFVSRINNGPWSNPSRQKELKLRFLRPGNYTVEAYAVDQFLNQELTPAAVTFEVSVKEEAQLARLITVLSDERFEEREAAVQALIGYGERALPPLREALRSAEDNHRWWVEAAIQKIEHALTMKKQ